MKTIFNIKQIFNIAFLFILFTFLFGRSFMGLYIFGFRIGELLIGSCLVASFLAIFNNVNNKKVFNKRVIYLNYLIWFSFLISLFLSKGNFYSIYIFKSSSYIWSISFLYVGVIFFKNFKFTKSKILILNLSLIYVYVLSTVYYPKFIINFFIDNSDKWDFNKASSLGIFFIVAGMLNNRFKKYFKFSLEFFVIISALFLPLFLYKSRGAFVAIFLFVCIELFEYRKELFKNNLKTYILISIALITGMLSTIRVLNQDVQDLIEEQKLLSIFYSGEAVEKLASQKDTRVESFITFYLNDGRLYSIDGNFNWRMQIWQDVVFDSIKDGKVLFGNGYLDIIPAMQKYERQGNDGLNENVHNFIVNIFARGGLVQLIIFLFFYYFLINNQKKKSKRELFVLSLPIFIISIFDNSMENAHFPVIYYLFSSFFSFEFED